MSKPPHERLAALETLDHAGLRKRWTDYYRSPPPRHASRDLLLRAIAYRMQEQAEGGLSKAALKRLAALASPKGSKRGVRPSTPRPRAGTRLIRAWRGEVHRVSVCDDGFDYRGTRYASLSQIAREITGTRWSGPLFFGLRKGRTGSEGSTHGS